MLIEKNNRIAKHYFSLTEEDGTVFKSFASMHVVQTIHTYIDYMQIAVTIARLLGKRLEAHICVCGEDDVTYYCDFDGIEKISSGVDYDRIRRIFGGRND